MHRKSILKGKVFIKHKQRIQNTGDRRQEKIHMLSAFSAQLSALDDRRRPMTDRR